MINKFTETWDNDEDYYPANGEYEAEYVEDVEDEDEAYEHMYSPIQGSWYLDEYEDEAYGQRKNRRMRIRSVKAYDEAKTKERKKNQKRWKAEAKAREKERKKYYHYDDVEEE